MITFILFLKTYVMSNELLVKKNSCRLLEYDSVIYSIVLLIRNDVYRMKSLLLLKEVVTEERESMERFDMVCSPIFVVHFTTSVFSFLVS